MKYGIYGYGNLGHALEIAVRERGEEVGVIFTRRDPAKMQSATGAPIRSAAEAEAYAEGIDLLFMATGSAFDLPQDTPRMARLFHLVDCCDCHARLASHIAAADRAARETGHVALVAAGWDPGLFSVFRALSAAIAPQGECMTLWGRGVSQGHSEAVRRLPGVRFAKVYTIPSEAARRAVFCGTVLPAGTPLHRRECYIVAEAGTEERIRAEVLDMPHYFRGTPTEITFLCEEEFAASHGECGHAGRCTSVFHTGERGDHIEKMILSLSLASNPEFTAAVMAAYGCAALSLARAGQSGAFTPMDIPPRLLLSEAEKYL